MKRELQEAETLTDTTTTAIHKLGITFRDGDKSYRYVQLDASAAAAATAGRVLYFTTASYVAGKKIVTDDISTTKQSFVAGIAIGAIALGAHGWIQTWGYNAEVDMFNNADSGASVAVGDAIIGHATTDGNGKLVAAGTAPTHKVVGWATAAMGGLSASTVAVFLEIEEA